MPAKIFPESQNLYDDAAAVLFDYYKSAAQKIVGEELDAEKKTAVKEADLATQKDQAESQRKKMILFLAGAGAALIVGIIVAFAGDGGVSALLFFIAVALGLAIAGVMAHLNRKKVEAQMAETQSAIAALKQAHTKIRRDYKLHKLGVAYVPVATQLPFEGKSILIDHSGSSEGKEFHLYMVKNQEEFSDTINSLETATREVPIVETADSVEDVFTGEYSRAIQEVQMFDYFGNLDRKMRSASYLLNDLDEVAVTMPVVMPDGKFAAFLRDHGTSDVGDAPTIPVFPLDTYDEQIRNFIALNEMKKSMESKNQEFEAFLQGLMGRLAATVQAVSRLKLASSNSLLEQANQYLFTSFKASFNHYSPQLEAEEIERIRNESFNYEDSVDSYQNFNLKSSSRVKFDPGSRNWVADDGARTSFPFAVHQIHEEIVAPIVQNLMQETRIERMRIYNNIKDQKLDYLNQWHRDTDDFYGRNRAAGLDLTNLMQASLTEFTAAFNQYKAFADTQKSMQESGSLENAVVDESKGSAESVLAYEAKSSEFAAIQQEFNDYMDRLKEEIDRKAEKFAHIEYYDASMRDGDSRKRSDALTRVDSLDPRRKPLLAVDSYFAASAFLPPAPDMDQRVYESLAVNLPMAAEAAVREITRPAAPAAAGDGDAGVAAPPAAAAAPAPVTAPAAAPVPPPAAPAAAAGLDDMFAKAAPAAGDAGEMFECAECGAEVAADATVCPNCGETFTDDDE
jgi:hypothetical protein